MSVAVIALNAAYVAFVATAYTRTLAWLRALLIIGSGCLIIYGTIEQIWPMVGWNALIIATHVFRMVSDRRAQNSVTLTDDQSGLRDQFFPGISDFDFHMLWSMGDTIQFEDQQVVVKDGSRPTEVFAILDGTVSIEKDGATLNRLARGALVGELSFMAKTHASVDVVADGTVRTRRWDQQQLAALDQTHPPSAKAFREMITSDLARKAYA